MSVFGKKESRSNFAAGRQDRSPSPAMVYFVFCSATLFSLVHVWSIYRAAHQGHLTFVAIGLRSLVSLNYRGRLHLVIHDDSVSATQRKEVDQAVQELRRRTDYEVLLLRRPTKEGGKAGVTNYVLLQTAYLFEYFLLCDNDSTALDPRAIEKALPYFENPAISVLYDERESRIPRANQARTILPFATVFLLFAIPAALFMHVRASAGEVPGPQIHGKSL